MNDQVVPIQEERVISIALWKAVAIVVSAMLGSAGVGLYGSLATINNDHFTVLAIDKEIASIKQDLVEIKVSFMPLDLATEKWKNNDKQHEEIIKKLDGIQLSINRLK